MKVLLTLMVIVITLLIYDRATISFDHAKEDFASDYRQNQQDFQNSVKNFGGAYHDSNDTTDTNTSVQMASPLSQKIRPKKNSFDESFEATSKMIEEKWKNF